MKDKFKNIINSDKVFLWIAVIISVLLLVPLIAMQFSNEVVWTVFDFLVFGILLFVSSSAFVIIARKTKRNWLLVALIVGIIFLYVWAELAVGIFTNLGS